MLQREIDPETMADVDKFEVQLARYRSGELEADAFRVFRLNNGIYGQRQGGDNQMLRVKIPYGSVTPDQLDMLGHIAETYSRGWATSRPGRTCSSTTCSSTTCPLRCATSPRRA